VYICRRHRSGQPSRPWPGTCPRGRGSVSCGPPVSVVVVFPTVLHRPETRRWILTGKLAAQSVNPSPTLTLPRATGCLRRRRVTVLGCSRGSPQWSSDGGTRRNPLRAAPPPSTSLNVAHPDRSVSGIRGHEHTELRRSLRRPGMRHRGRMGATCVSLRTRRRLWSCRNLGVNDVMVGAGPRVGVGESGWAVRRTARVGDMDRPARRPGDRRPDVVAETILNSVTGVPPISTLDTGSSKSVPVITTTQPAGPLVGENDVMVGRPRVPRPPGRARLRSPRPRPPLCVDRGVARTGSWLRPRSANEIYPAPLALPAPDVIRSSAMVITTV